MTLSNRTCSRGGDALIRTTAAAMIAAASTLLVLTGSAAAGKGGNDRAPTPRTAATTTPRVSPFIDVANQVRAQPGVKTDKPCNKRHCNYWPHQH